MPRTMIGAARFTPPLYGYLTNGKAKELYVHMQKGWFHKGAEHEARRLYFALGAFIKKMDEVDPAREATPWNPTGK